MHTQNQKFSLYSNIENWSLLIYILKTLIIYKQNLFSIRTDFNQTTMPPIVTCPPIKNQNHTKNNNNVIIMIIFKKKKRNIIRFVNFYICESARFSTVLEGREISARFICAFTRVLSKMETGFCENSGVFLCHVCCNVNRCERYVFDLCTRSLSRRRWRCGPVARFPEGRLIVFRCYAQNWCPNLWRSIYVYIFFIVYNWSGKN